MKGLILSAMFVLLSGCGWYATEIQPRQVVVSPVVGTVVVQDYTYDDSYLYQLPVDVTTVTVEYY
jgi:hypothetical protein